MEITKIEQAAEAWKEENKEKRSIIVMAIEVHDEEGEKQGVESVDLVLGNRGDLITHLYHRMKDKNKEKDEHNVLPAMLRQGISRLTMDAMIEDIERKGQKLMKMAKKLGFLDDEDKEPETTDETAATDAKEGGQHE